MASAATLLSFCDLKRPKDTYIYSLAQVGDVFAATLSDDSLRLLDSTRLQERSGPIACHRSVTCLAADSDDQSFVTAGRDGLVKTWSGKDGVNTITIATPDGKGVSAVASGGHLIAAGTESTKEGPGDVGVYVWDRRSPGTPLRSYLDSHNDTITGLSFGPFDPTLVLSSSTDALVTLFDTTQVEEDDAVRQVFNHGGAVNLAGFLSADEVVAVSSDESLSVYEISRPEDVEDEDVHALSTAYGDVRSELGATYVAQLARSGQGETWLASGNLEAKELRLTPLVRSEGGKTKWGFDRGRALVFPGGHGEELVRDVLLDEARKRVISCGEDGFIKVWAVPETPDSDEMDVEDTNADDLETRRQKERKRRKKEKRERQKEKLKHG